MIQRTVPRVIVEQLLACSAQWVRAPLTPRTIASLTAQAQDILVRYPETQDLLAVVGPDGGRDSLTLSFLSPCGIVWLSD